MRSTITSEGRGECTRMKRNRCLLACLVRVDWSCCVEMGSVDCEVISIFLIVDSLNGRLMLFSYNRSPH